MQGSTLLVVNLQTLDGNRTRKLVTVSSRDAVCRTCSVSNLKRAWIISLFPNLGSSSPRWPWVTRRESMRVGSYSLCICQKRRACGCLVLEVFNISRTCFWWENVVIFLRSFSLRLERKTRRIRTHKWKTEMMTNLATASFICMYKSSAISRKGATNESDSTDWVPKICRTSRIFWINDFLYNVVTPGMELAEAKVDSLQKHNG